MSCSARAGVASAAYDALPKASCPAWVRENWSKRTPVDFADEAEAKIEELRSCLTMYDNKTEAGLDRAKRAMRQVTCAVVCGLRTARPDHLVHAPRGVLWLCRPWHWTCGAPTAGETRRSKTTPCTGGTLTG